jgi:large subunit ribosomal protein L21
LHAQILKGKLKSFLFVKIMYAIVNIAGKQVKVEPGNQLFVDLLHHEPGAEITFNEVLLVGADGGKTTLGQPFVSGASVTAKVLSHAKGPKIVVFKKKRRKGYMKRNGHRQQYSKIEIQAIA